MGDSLGSRSDKAARSDILLKRPMAGHRFSVPLRCRNECQWLRLHLQQFVQRPGNAFLNVVAGAVASHGLVRQIGQEGVRQKFLADS